MRDDESCVCCMSCPRAVRTQPCGHAVYCELCTIRAVQASGLKCGVCRGAVLKLVVVPVNPASDTPHLRSMQTYQTEPEPEGSVFESVDAFLQAKLGSDDAEVAEAAQAALARVSGQGEDQEEEQEGVDFTLWEGVDFEFHTLREGLGSEPLVPQRFLVGGLVFCGGLGLFHVLRGLGFSVWYTYLSVGAH
eukprot:scaffold51495_cov61-Phaeocystis_antarctica.AAC.1